MEWKRKRDQEVSGRVLTNASCVAIQTRLAWIGDVANTALEAQLSQSRKFHLMRKERRKGETGEE